MIPIEAIINLPQGETVDLGKRFLGIPMEVGTKSVRTFVSHVMIQQSVITSEKVLSLQGDSMTFCGCQQASLGLILAHGP